MSGKIIKLNFVQCPVHGKQRGGMRIVMTGDKTDYDKEFCMRCYIENVIEPNCHELKPIKEKENE